MLRKHLLPRKFSPIGEYPSRVYTGVVAFRLLSHASIEEYLETRASDIAVAASKAAALGHVSFSAACLVSFTEHNFGPPPETMEAPQDSQRKFWAEKIDIRARISRSTSSYIKYARMENHGIREKNVLRLLVPIGADCSSFDPILISELNSFGERRGIFAHSSAVTHVTSKPDPKDELDKVSNIVKLLRDVDKELDRVRSVNSVD